MKRPRMRGDLHDPVENDRDESPLGMEHVLTVLAADVAAGVQQIYNIMGNATHNHTVTLSADTFAMLRAGMSISTVSLPVR